ncbi:hypothetical protein [Limnospira platensis]|uniref:hypothetical protein n=1 Tax=Limnospira platensis TaxID=118562 RepID=UPI0001D0E6A5|nr:hypothetical protein [Arthrospira platensis NCB002]QQW27514.1 hypothetical protein AP9108_20115 [Arthrospira sp. PCC 9108]BAI91984.1 hypothetical protein NIES39_K03380 [Arthrospira platensis NIES-39]MDF2212454.1 hypothetical protein [Arthrospira platensis NCB002]QQW27516.1 hypothetical protein AP9108_20125 [Arthrospira sp. PCC 9108]
MVRQHGIIPWDLYSLVLTHPTGGDRTLPHPTTLPPYGRLREATGGDRTIIEIKTGALI